jgi:hypothetical protein
MAGSIELFTLAYPALGAADARLIESFRRRHDLRYGNVEAHFTMVFGCAAIPRPAYLGHVEAVSRGRAALQFTCRYAMLSAGHDDDCAYVCLVPDEGYSALSLLHDALYQGALGPHLRLEIPYVPHITIGMEQDRRVAKDLCTALNGAGIVVQGRVEALTVAALEGSQVRNLASFQLEGG